MNIIEINNLTKYYGKSRGVLDVSFNVKKGEIFGFIGPNGAGKSTTIRTLLGLIKASEGSIYINGKNIDDSLVELLKDIGYLPSEVFYYDRLKAIDLLRYSASFYEGNYEERIRYLANYLDLDLNARVDDMSYGNKKKVGIVQGLLHNPSLIVLDEPTGGLDPIIQQRFFELIKEENRRGATIIFSSHILSEVQRLCNRVGIIKDGKLIKVETIENLVKINLKYVTLTLNSNVDESVFNIDSVSDLVIDKNKVTFKYSGEMNKLLNTLGKVDITDISIMSPDLEDIFMHYYV